jgi:hypothetical protein
MKINVTRILADQDEKRAKPKPLPRIKIKVFIADDSVIPDVPPDAPKKIEQTQLSEKELILKDLWAQMDIVKVERGKLATRTSYLVDEVAEKLRKNEGPAVAKAFLEGEIAMPEIAEHAASIQQWIDKGAQIYDKIKHVELYGSLHETKALPDLVGAGKSQDAKAMSADIRALDKLISKTNKKMLSGLKPKNKGRVQLWKEKIERAKIQREELKRQLNTLQYEARAQRTGE